MGESKRNKKIQKNNSDSQPTKILGYEMTEFQKEKLIKWTIEGLIIGVILSLVLWLPWFS